MKRKISEAIEKIGKDTKSINQFDVIPEVRSEGVTLQAVAPVSYAAAVEQSKREKAKFVKMIDDKTKSAQGLDNKDEDRFKHMNKSTGKSDLKVDQPGLKKMHLDESLFTEDFDGYYRVSFRFDGKDGVAQVNLVKAGSEQEAIDKLRAHKQKRYPDRELEIFGGQPTYNGEVNDLKKRGYPVIGEGIDSKFSNDLNEGLEEKLTSLFRKKNLDKYVDISNIVDDAVTIYNNFTPKKDRRYKMKAESFNESIADNVGTYRLYFGSWRDGNDTIYSSEEDLIEFLKDNYVDLDFKITYAKDVTSDYKNYIDKKTITDIKNKMAQKMFHREGYVSKQVADKVDESLNEGVQEDDSWNEDAISELEHYDVLSSIADLKYELRGTIRGAFTGAKTADELGQYIKDLADQLDSFGDEIIALGDTEDMKESLLQESNWSDRYFKWTKVTQAKLDKIGEAGLFDDLHLDVMESEDEDSPLHEITRFYNEDGWAVTAEAYGGPNETELKEISKTLYNLINDYYKKAISKDESLNNPYSLKLNQTERSKAIKISKSMLKGIEEKPMTEDELYDYIDPDKDEEEEYLDYAIKYLLNNGKVIKKDGKYYIKESINESRKPLKEAIVISDVKTFKPWSGAIATYERIQGEDKLEQLEAMIEEMYPDGIEAQTLNDLLWFDNDFVYQMLNIRVEED